MTEDALDAVRDWVSVAIEEIRQVTGGSSNRGRFSHLWGALWTDHGMAHPLTVSSEVRTEAADFVHQYRPQLSDGTRALLDLVAADIPASSARRAVAARWDDVVREWVKGSESLDPELSAWWNSYRGGGKGKPKRDAFPEPYIGPLTGRPRLAMLGLNPGPPELGFQGRGGRFARQFERMPYSTWAAGDPYGSDEWERYNGVNPRRAGRAPNPYRRARLGFARRWCGDRDVGGHELLTIELFPWHSERVTASMVPPREVVERFIWAPLRELELAVVFAFGKPWLRIVERLGLSETWRCEPGSRHFSSRVRGAAAFELRTGQTLAVVWQSAYAGPPGEGDTERLRELLEG